MDECKRNKSQGATEHQDQAGCLSQTERSAHAERTRLASFQEDAFLSRALERVLPSLASDTVLLGMSGGADSAMLLVYTSLLAPKYHKRVVALHIHHGLQQPADAWAAHSQALCEMLGVEFIFKRVAVNETSGLGMEASARQARYQAYYEVAQERACYDYLLAHHQNDQAETVLLRLLRGTGAQGMAAMSAMSEYEGVRYHRPWLDVPRARILASAAQWGELTGWHPVQDPTNHDTAYTRAAVRELLVPSLDARWPSWQSNVIRHAQLMQENSLLLSDLAEIDLANLKLSEDKRSFSLIAWRELSEHRQANALRYWLGLQGVLMPSQARMQEWMRQLRSVHQMGTDRKVEFKHQGAVIRLVRGWVEFER